jgi:serine/threonine protein kinase
VRDGQQHQACCPTQLQSFVPGKEPAAAACAAGLDYLHATGVIYCDLQPANVLLKAAAADQRGYTCKLGNFSRCQVLDVEQAPMDHAYLVRIARRRSYSTAC